MTDCTVFIPCAIHTLEIKLQAGLHAWNLTLPGEERKALFLVNYFITLGSEEGSTIFLIPVVTMTCSGLITEPWVSGVCVSPRISMGTRHL